MKDFRNDLVELAQYLERQKPFALTRFGDGELRILRDEHIDLRGKAHGEFLYEPSDSGDKSLRAELLASFTHDHADYRVGIGCPCCIGDEAFEWMRAESGLPDSRLTWANLLVNSNYGYFRQHVLPLFASYETFLVCRRLATVDNLPFPVARDWRVGINAWRDDHGLIQELARVATTKQGALFLFCAGPLANLMAHQLFVINPHNTYVNLGSTLDPYIFGNRGLTRGYLRGADTLAKKCIWGQARSHSQKPRRLATTLPATPTEIVPSALPSAQTVSNGRCPLPALHNGSSLPDKSPITVVLTAYRRPQLLARQLAAVRAQTVPPAAVWAWVNEPDTPMLDALANIELDCVVMASRNRYFHSRFALALTANTPYVALFDDDSIPGPEWFANCLETMSRSPGILGAAGVRILGADYQRRTVHGWHDPQLESTEVDLVGHAWFLRREWLHFLFAEPASVPTNGEDIELSARAWRLGGIRTFCPPHPVGDRTRWGSTNGELGADCEAASRRATHLQERDTVVRAEIAAGWQPLAGRSALVPANDATHLEEVNKDGSSTTSKQRLLSKAGSKHGLTPTEEELSRRVSGDARHVLYIGRAMSSLAEHLTKRTNTCLTVVDTSCFGRQEMVSTKRLSGNESSTLFDAIVCNGGFDRAEDAQQLLGWIRSQLSPHGLLIADFANVRHQAIVKSLLAGRWDAANGAACAPPRRYYTRREFEKLCYRAGFDAPAFSAVSEKDAQQRSAGEVSLGRLQLAGLSESQVDEFFAESYVVSCQASSQCDYPLTSIIIPTHNQLIYTHQCLESIRGRTDEPFELVVVDNGSTDGTVDYLRSLADARRIENQDNRGFAIAVNQGIRAARGQQIVVLNNDTLATTGWLRRMLDALARDARIGLVGPCSNCVSGPQMVQPGYCDLASLDGFAWEFGKTRSGRMCDVDRLVGFCLAFRRQLLDEIGLFDERFAIGNFEDDDFTRRVLQAGYRAVIAEDSFVHHFGGRTFAALDIDYSTILAENERKFRDKWQITPTTGAPTAPQMLVERRPPVREPTYQTEVATDGGLVLVSSPIRLSLCMIVRDNAHTLDACLESIKPWVDEMVVVDTGSVDETPDIARRYGARVFEFPWCDDFSAARNESLRHARGEWLFWMDSDDTISTMCGEQLRKLTDGTHRPKTLGYVMQVHCPGHASDGSDDVTVVDHVKLFRNLPDLRFEGRIHEQILPALRRVGGEVAWTDIFVVHSGSDVSAPARARKQERDLRILSKDLQDRPDHPFVLFNLGMTYADTNEHEQAIEYLRRSIAVSDPTESHVRKAYALLVGSLMQRQEFQEAYDVCRQGREHFPDDVELLFRQGIVLHQLGRLEEAAQSYLSALEERGERHFSSVDRGIKGFKARHNLALVYEDMGRLTEAEEQWRLAIAEVPPYRMGWRQLADNLMRQRRPEAVDAVLQEMESLNALAADRHLIRSRLATERAELRLAKHELDAAANHSPEDLDVLKARCQFYFEHEDPNETIGLLQKLVAAEPQDAAAHQNLGTALLRAQEYESAVVEYREALRLRPGEASTYCYLGHALEQLDRVAESFACWQEALRLQPNLESACAAIARLSKGASTTATETEELIAR